MKFKDKDGREVECSVEEYNQMVSGVKVDPHLEKLKKQAQKFYNDPEVCAIYAAFDDG